MSDDPTPDWHALGDVTELAQTPPQERKAHALTDGHTRA